MKDNLTIETVKDIVAIILTFIVTCILLYPTNPNVSIFYIIMMIVPLTWYYTQMKKYKEEGENHSKNYYMNKYHDPYIESLYHDLYIEKLFALKAFSIIEFTHILILIGRWY